MIARTLMFAALSAMLLTGCASTGVAPAPASTKIVPGLPYDLSAAEKTLIEAGLRSSLKDPTSPIFGKMVATKEAGKDEVLVCGYINAKNSYGGYTGDQPYMGLIVGDASGKRAFLVAGMGGGAPEKATAVYMVCRDGGITL